MLGGNQYRCILIAAALAAVLPTCSGTARDRRDAADRARRSLAQGDTTAAIEHIEGINLRKQQDPALYVLLGRLYRDLGTINGRLQSQRLLEGGLQKFPNNADLLFLLGAVDLNLQFANLFLQLLFTFVNLFRHALEDTRKLA